MSEYDASKVYYTDQGMSARDDSGAMSAQQARNAFQHFIREYKRSSDDTFFYRDMLRQNYNRKESYSLAVNLDHLTQYGGGVLLDRLLSNPRENLKLFEEACKDALYLTLGGKLATAARFADGGTGEREDMEPGSLNRDDLPEFQSKW